MENNKIVYIAIEAIKANPNNPRKTFAEGALTELSESIKELGVLQPITVRPFGACDYQLICGERRWRAAQMAGLAEIPAIVRDLNDDDAMDIAITENLQRHDVSPFEEADAFQFLIDNKNYSISDLCKRFGKSESFIRQRLKLSNLIPEVKELAQEDVLSIAQVMELCKFSTDVQHDVYKDHLAPNVIAWHNWQEYSAKRILELIEQHYTGIIANQKFDTTECQHCINNSANLMLFESAATARCYDRSCLKRKVLEYEMKQVEKTLHRYPTAEIMAYRIENELPQALMKAGHEVKQCEHPSYKWTKLGAAISKELRADVEKGNKLIAVIIDYSNDVYLAYIDTANEGSPVVAENEIQKLEKKDKRNKEIATEKTISEIRDKVNKWDFDFLSGGVLSEQEKQAVLVVLMGNLNTRQIQELHFADKNYYHLTLEECVRRAKTLTNEQVSYIVRSAIINHIGNHAYMSDATKFFHEWVSSKDDKLVPEVSLKYEEEYLKRQEKIQAKIDAINNNKAE